MISTTQFSFEFFNDEIWGLSTYSYGNRETIYNSESVLNSLSLPLDLISISEFLDAKELGLLMAEFNCLDLFRDILEKTEQLL